MPWLRTAVRWRRPRALFAPVAAMVTGVALALTVTVFWKISIHTARAACTVAILVIMFGPALWTAAPVAVAWARVVLRDRIPLGFRRRTAGTSEG